MNYRISKFEYFFTFLLFIVAIVGIVTTLSNKVTKGTGSITTNNYKDFIDIYVVTGNGYGNPSEYYVAYTVYLDSKKYALTEISITYRLESSNSNLSTYTKTVGFIDSNNHFVLSAGEAKYTNLGNTGFIDLDDIRIYVESVTGKYHYSNK